MKHWSMGQIYFAGIAAGIVCLGIAGIILAVRQPNSATRQVTLLEACSTMCNGHVESFQIDWRNQPICNCR